MLAYYVLLPLKEYKEFVYVLPQNTKVHPKGKEKSELLGRQNRLIY